MKQREECANIFTPKFFYVVNSRMDRNDLTNGEKMLNVVKEMIKDHIKNNPDADELEYNIKNNVIKGFDLALIVAKKKTEIMDSMVI